MLTNLRDAFGGQSKSPNIVPFHMLGIVSYCAIVTLSLRRAVFTIFDFKNAVTLKTALGVRQGHWKCHHVIEHNDFLLTFYSNYGSISCCFWDIQCRKMSWGQRSLKVIESCTIRQTVYGFLLVFYSNFVPKMRRFLDIRLQICRDHENRVRGPSKVIGNLTMW